MKQIAFVILFSIGLAHYGHAQRATYLGAEGGLALEFVIAKKLHLNITTSYFTCFKKLANMDIYYTVNSNPWQHVKKYSKGEYWALSLGFCYPISDIWKKSPETPGPENK